MKCTNAAEPAQRTVRALQTSVFVLSCVRVLLTSLALDEGCTVDTFLDAGVGFVRVDVNLIERAVGLGAEVVRALVDGAVDIRVFLIVHSALRSFPRGIELPCNIIMPAILRFMHPY